MTTKTGSDPWRAARKGVVAIDAGPAAAVRISGPDARRFCNGMFTNNVRDLPVGATNRSAMVEDRGRVIGFLDLLCEAPDTFLAVLDGLDAAAFLARYEKYVVFDDVTLDDRTGALHAFSLQGPDAAAALVSVGLDAPAPGTFGVLEEAVLFARRRSPASGFDLVVPTAASEAWRSRLGAVASWSDAGLAEILRVTAGRAQFPIDTGDKRLPHELGLRDEILSFDKGCYLGQESINRIDVMGQVKRMLVGVLTTSKEAAAGGAATGEMPPHGAEVRAGDVVVGELTSPVVLPDGDGFGLAILKRPADVPGTLVTVSAAGRTWTGVVVALPYDPRDPSRDG